MKKDKRKMQKRFEKMVKSEQPNAKVRKIQVKRFVKVIIKDDYKR